MKMPEEVNRILADRLSAVLYCPTEIARKNLVEEGFLKFGNRMLVCGDVMYDAVLYYLEKAKKQSPIRSRLKPGKFILCTLHRAENTDDPARLKSIFIALQTLSRKFNVVLPLHPRTKKLLASSGTELGFEPIDPVGYFDMLVLLSDCEFVLTDSGGLQKEAYFFSKPCITMRDQTEWVELIEARVNMLTGADTQKILEAADIMTGRSLNFRDRLYGDGHASEVIAKDLLNHV